MVDRPERWLVELKGGRPTIYDESTRGAGTTFDTGPRQTEVLRAMAPLTVLRTHPDPGRCTVFLVRAVASSRLEQLLSVLARRASEAILVVVDDSSDPSVARAARRWNYRSEVHLVDGRSPGPEAARLAEEIARARPMLSACALEPDGDGGAVVHPVHPMELLSRLGPARLVR